MSASAKNVNLLWRAIYVQSSRNAKQTYKYNTKKGNRDGEDSHNLLNAFKKSLSDVIP